MLRGPKLPNVCATVKSPSGKVCVSPLQEPCHPEPLPVATVSRHQAGETTNRMTLSTNRQSGGHIEALAALLRIRVKPRVRKVPCRGRARSRMRSRVSTLLGFSANTRSMSNSIALIAVSLPSADEEPVGVERPAARVVGSRCGAAAARAAGAASTRGSRRSSLASPRLTRGALSAPLVDFSFAPGEGVFADLSAVAESTLTFPAPQGNS